MATIPLFSFRIYSAIADPSAVGFNTYSLFNTEWYWLSYQGTEADQLAEYYSNLLILQYLQKPKANATIQALVYPVIMNQLPILVQNGFNLTGSDTAIGVQLDVLGKYVGVTRTNLGFTGTITLDDADFLILINMAIILNSAGSSLASIQSFMFQYFPGQVYVFDYQSMSMSYLIDSAIGNQNLLQIFVTEGLLPRPMGVQMSVISASVINKFFGLRTYWAVADPLSTPLNSYTSYQTSWLFMTYADAVTTL